MKKKYLFFAAKLATLLLISSTLFGQSKKPVKRFIYEHEFVLNLDNSLLGDTLSVFTLSQEREHAFYYISYKKDTALISTLKLAIENKELMLDNKDEQISNLQKLNYNQSEQIKLKDSTLILKDIQINDLSESLTNQRGKTLVSQIVSGALLFLNIAQIVN